MVFKIQRMDGRRVLGHSQTHCRSVFSPRGQVLPAESLLNIVDVELIYGGVKYILKVKVSISGVSLTLWGLKGVLLLPHATAAVDFLMPGPGIPLQSYDLETYGLWIPEPVGLGHMHKQVMIEHVLVSRSCHNEVP